METALSKLYTNQLIPLSLHHHRSTISPSISSLSFRIPQPSFPSLKSLPSSLSCPIKASSSSPNPKPPILKTLIKTTLVASLAATALYFARFNRNRPAIVSPPPAAQVSIPSEGNNPIDSYVSDKLSENNLQQTLTAEPDDLEALKGLLELKIKEKKVKEAVEIIDHLIELEPEDKEWPLLKSHIYYSFGDTHSAKIGFNEILNEDPFRVEAYHGLVLAATQSESDLELKEIEKRIRKGSEIVEKENKKDDLRDFKLLLAQVRVIEGEYDDALKIYEELVKEEPNDFRPYLCQGIIYTLLRKKDEADKNFQRYKRLIPVGHPYASYLENNLIATKLFSQKVENERVRAKS